MQAHSKHSGGILSGLPFRFSFEGDQNVSTFECCWNAVTARENILNAVRVQLEYTSNVCHSIFFHFECTSNIFSMIQTFGPATRMGPNIWNALRMQSDFFRMHFEYSGM